MKRSGHCLVISEKHKLAEQCEHQMQKTFQQQLHFADSKIFLFKIIFKRHYFSLMQSKQQSR